MKSSKLIDILQSGNIVIPIYLLKKYKELKLELDEFIFLMYLYNKGNNIVFNPSLFSEELNISLEKVMEYISNLSDKNCIKIDVINVNKKVKDEVIILDDLYNKLSLLVAEDVNNADNTESNIYEVIEKEFGRTLSPMEYEIIKAWLDSNYSEELITEALREATFNGVSNLRYIDKILYEWSKKGIKNKDDVLKNKKSRKKTKEKNSNIDMEIMDWDWFDEKE